MRKVSEHINDNGTKKAIVYRDSEFNEYVVRFWIDGVRQLEADYHTDEKDDAVATAMYEISRS